MNDEIFEKAVNNLKLFHCIFIVEESKQSLNILSNKLKIPFNLTSILKPHANKHSNSKYPPISEEANELLESMVTRMEPTRAEVNDVYNTLIDGATGLVLAAETAIGKYPQNV